MYVTSPIIKGDVSVCPYLLLETHSNRVSVCVSMICPRLNEEVSVYLCLIFNLILKEPLFVCPRFIIVSI